MTAGRIEGPTLWDRWVKLWPLLRPAYERSTEKADILAGIMAQQLQLWAVQSKDAPVGVIVSRLLRSTEGTSAGQLHARIWLVGGVRLFEWADDFLNIFVPWARSEGATSVMGGGRLGWDRLARRHGGYRVDDEEGRPMWRMDIR